ncbi:ricin-type beta-trefoil lectin domain protein [Streptomyces sp. NPDC006512]|uniref:RICIN domain-containing protein n=1 Tax=Streptomyces sp. NPDC006512 TaxID=3154307 RepID=UPI0033BBDABB
MTDQQLCEAIRVGNPAAPVAETELRGRHRPRVAAFALTVANDPVQAQHAADRAIDQFVLGMRGPAAEALDRPPRPALLALVAPPAPPAPPGFDPALHSLVARGFAALSFRKQALLWHSVVEREPDDLVATVTGDRPEAVPVLTERALAACRDACLRAHLSAQPTPGCRGYARLLDAAASRSDVRSNPDLTRHVGACPGCAVALRGLVALCDNPRPVLAGSLLGPSGAAYLSAVVPAATDSGGRAGPTAGARSAVALLRRPAGRIALAVAGVLVAATLVVVAVRPAAGPPVAGRAPTALPPRADGGSPAPGPGRTGARSSASASPSGTRSPGSPSPQGSPGTSPSPEGSASGPTASSGATPAEQASAAVPVRPFRASDYGPAVNSATGLCLDVHGGVFANGVDVVTARCRDGASVQQWRLDERGLLRNAANPGYCMDARGTTGDGVGIWSCSAIGTKTGQNLVFSTDAAGRIKPHIAPGFAVTSGSGEPGAPVAFGRAGGAAEQRWNESAAQR